MTVLPPDQIRRRAVFSVDLHDHAPAVRIPHVPAPDQQLIEVADTRVRTVHVHRPTLDDVFLHYTGRPIRDDHAGTARPMRVRAHTVGLAVITRLTPLTYAVDPLRHVVLASQSMPPAAAARFSTGVSLFGYTLPVAAELGITCAFAAAVLALAVAGFGKPE